MSESLLVTHCSPTLAGMKTGNLFNCRCGSRKQLRLFIDKWNRMLNPKGVYIKAMRCGNGRALIYVYRRAKLEHELQNREVGLFLKKCGYSSTGLEETLERLACRLRESDEFPHEIGVFLGYPFEDVKGFIENKGKNYKHVGHWKVYADECAAKRTFSKYNKCTDIYCRMLEEGTDLLKLTVEGRHLVNA